MAFLILRTKRLEITQFCLLNQVSCPSDVTLDLPLPLFKDRIYFDSEGRGGVCLLIVDNFTIF